MCTRYTVPCNSTFCGGGSLAKWRRQAIPRRRRAKGPSTPASKIFCLSFFQKQFQLTSSVGVPATLNILSSWSKTSLGKHRGEFVSFLKRSFSLSKFVDTWRPGSTDSRSSSQRICTQRPTCPDWVRKHQSKTVLLTKDSKIESFITESSQ